MKSFIQSSLTLLLLLTAFNINASELKVMTYNIWGLPFPIAKRIKRFKVLKKIIAKQDVDFIGFQEAFTRTALKVTKHKNFPHVAYGPKKCLLNLSSGLVLISKYPIPFYLGGTSILIVVVVAMDTVTQVQTRLMSSQYESLIKKTKFGK